MIEEMAAAYRSGLSLSEVAARFSVSVPTVHRKLIAHGVERRPRGHVASVTDREREIVAVYRTTGAITITAERLGITRQAVQQALASFERKTGERIPRVGKHLETERRRRVVAKRGVNWRCAGCGTERTLTPSQAKRITMCERCNVERRHARRKYLSDAALATVIERALAGEELYPLAREYGFLKNNLHALSGLVYTELRLRGDLAAIDKIWPRGLPPWIRKRYADIT